jgi:glycosyltransferase involved in cell wall biosynthesis
MVTIYTITFNEEILIQFMIDYYRQRFPGCRIVVYDNQSTDQTVKIALKNNCEVIPFDTNNQYQEGLQIKIRNNCWKNSSTDWVLVCDLDELLDINELKLRAESKLGSTIISTKTYDMINLKDNIDIASMKHGVSSPLQGKLILFNKKYINEINYGPGSHSCNPKGRVIFSKKNYKLFHYNSINQEVTIQKFKERAARMSLENLANNWGIHFLMTPEEIRKEYKIERRKAKKVK